MRDDPFLQPLKKSWIPREMLIAPALAAHVPTAPIEPGYILLINPFYAKDANASFGKHVLTPSLALTSDELRTFEAFSLPASSIEIEDAPGLESEIRIPGKDPTAVLPRTQGIGTQPTPECRTADLSDDTLSHHLLADIGQGQPRERQPETMRKLTGEGFYLHDDAGGKTGRDARLELVPRGPVDEPVQIVCATCSRSGVECPSVQR